MPTSTVTILLLRYSSSSVPLVTNLNHQSSLSINNMRMFLDPLNGDKADVRNADGIPVAELNHTPDYQGHVRT